MKSSKFVFAPVYSNYSMGGNSLIDILSYWPLLGRWSCMQLKKVTVMELLYLKPWVFVLAGVKVVLGNLIFRVTYNFVLSSLR